MWSIHFLFPLNWVDHSSSMNGRIVGTQWLPSLVVRNMSKGEVTLSILKNFKVFLLSRMASAVLFRILHSSVVHVLLHPLTEPMRPGTWTLYPKTQVEVDRLILIKVKMDKDGKGRLSLHISRYETKKHGSK